MDEVSELLRQIYRELDCTPVLGVVVVHSVDDPHFEWTADYRRGVRHRGRTVATLDEQSVRDRTLVGVLRTILEAERRRDADLLAYLTERLQTEEKADG